MSTEIECWSARIRGKVQGVGYRDTCAHHAKKLGVTGWVRNRLDGSVEAVLLGPRDQLHRMKAWLQHGPPLARVEEVVVHKLAEPHPGFERFEKHPTA